MCESGSFDIDMSDFHPEPIYVIARAPNYSLQALFKHPAFAPARIPSAITAPRPFGKSLYGNRPKSSDQRLQGASIPRHLNVIVKHHDHQHQHVHSSHFTHLRSDLNLNSKQTHGHPGFLFKVLTRFQSPTLF